MKFPKKSFAITSAKTKKKYQLVRGDEFPFGKDSAAEIVQVCSQPEVYELFRELFQGRPYTKKDAEFYIQLVRSGWEKGTQFFWIIAHEGAVVGTVGIKSLDGEVGYWQSSEHPGVMSQALSHVCELAQAAGFESLWAYASRKNLTSVRVLEKAGFSSSPLLTKKRPDAFGFRKYFG